MEIKKNKEIKNVLVVLNVFDFTQCMTESSKILKTDGVDGVILANIFFESEIMIQEKYPNLFMLTELIKYRYPKKIVGVEINKKEHAIFRKHRPVCSTSGCVCHQQRSQSGRQSLRVFSTKDF